jgi:flagellar motor component MotA
MKKKRSVGRIISILMLGIVLFWIMASANSFYAFIDIPSLLFITLISIAMLVFTNQWSDYFRAIKISMGVTEFTTKEYKASRNAMDLSIRTVLVSGIIGSMVGMVQLVLLTSELESMAAGMAVGILTLLYALIINIVQYAIKSMITKEIIYRENEDN